MDPLQTEPLSPIPAASPASSVFPGPLMLLKEAWRQTRARLGLSEEGAPVAQIMKTLHLGQGGKLSIGRVLRGTFHEGETVLGSRGAEARIGSLVSMVGSNTTRVPEAKAQASGSTEQIGGERLLKTGH